jgi:transcriptional regulator with XRE-family HTH domain
MSEIAPVFARIVAPGLLACLSMTTKEALRQQALRLVKAGITQKTIATKMHLSEAKVSRWLNEESVRIDTDEMDGLRAYLNELRTIVIEETQRADATAGREFSVQNARNAPPSVHTNRRGDKR